MTPPATPSAATPPGPQEQAALPKIVVVGLGPSDERLLTAETVRLLADAADDDRLVLRTRRHPAAAVVPHAPSFDDVYETADSFEEVYQTIVDRLADAARQGETIVYAVPGSPIVAEHTVELLLADDRVATELVPALSFVDLAWVRLGIDPLAEGVRIVDGRDFATAAAGERGPLLVAQCDQQHVLSDIKLSVDSAEVAEPIEVTVIQRLGLDDELISTVPWDDLDRSVEPDHLTSIYIPRLAAPIAGEMARFGWLVERLRKECPWDSAQTHQSLRRHLLEEAYEVLEAIDELDEETGEGFELLEEELGDLLFQVFIHAELAAEAGYFTVADVARGITDKLYGRHPHVFGAGADDDNPTVDELLTDWEAQKKTEKQRDSVMDGVPAVLPALLFASKVQKKAAGAGHPVSIDRHYDFGDIGDIGDEAAFGDVLMAVVSQAREADVDPEQALRMAAKRAELVFRAHEAAADEHADEEC